MSHRTGLLLLVLAAPVAACASDPTAPPTTDTNPRDTNDAGRDSTPDQQSDTQPDGKPDAGSDVQPDTGGDTTSDTGAVAITGPTSYTVTGTLTVQPRGPQPMHPYYAELKRQDFTLRLDPNAKKIIVGSGASVPRVFSVETADNRLFSASGPVSIAVPIPPSAGICGPSGLVRYTTFQIDAHKGGVTGKASGSLQLIAGDVAFLEDITLSLTGSIDATAPSFAATATGVDPLAVLPLSASEPLPPGTTGTLTAPGLTTPVTLEAIRPVEGDDAGAFALGGFRTAMGRALAYGTTYTLAVTPFADLAGNAGIAPAFSFTTAPAPAMLTDGGFESGGPLVGGAAVVDAGYLPPLTGAKSLFLAPDGPYGGAGNSGIVWNRRFTVRMPASTADKKLVFAARPVATTESPLAREVNIKVARPGGGLATALYPENGAAPFVRHEVPDARGGGTLYLGTRRKIEVPLPDGDSGEIAVDITVGYPPQACGLLPPTIGLVVDDLHLE